MTSYTTHHQDPSPLPVETYGETDYASALAEVRPLVDEPAAPLDAVIHGVGVRLVTHNPHWRRFWAANWFAPDQWATLTGQTPPREPRIHVYATRGEAESPRAGYSHAHKSAFLSGDVPYGPLRALALVAVARLLAEEEAAHFVPGVCLKVDGRGTLLLPPANLDAATVLATLLAREHTHLVALDGVFVRYGLLRIVDGVTLLPTLVIDEKGNPTPGQRLFPWLDEYGYWEPRADARCLTLEGAEEYCFARDLDLGRAPEAFAYPLEQAWYVPTQIVEARPDLAGVLWRASLENVPPLTPELLDRFGDWARQATSSPAEEIDQEQVTEALCRLRAAPQARAMLPPAQLWPGHAGGHPWRPLQIERLVTLSPDRQPGETLMPLDPAALAEHLSGAILDVSQDNANEIVHTFTDLLERAIRTCAS
jgi:hypothetical protein